MNPRDLLSGDPLLDELAAAMADPIDDGWDEWYAQHGSRAGVQFDGGFIPGVVDSLRFGVYRREGAERQAALDRELRREGLLA